MAQGKGIKANGGFPASPVGTRVPRIDGAEKVAGEAPIVATAAAITNAVADATGAFVCELPVTPERVLRTMAENRKTVGRPRSMRRGTLLQSCVHEVHISC